MRFRKAWDSAAMCEGVSLPHTLMVGYMCASCVMSPWGGQAHSKMNWGRGDTSATRAGKWKPWWYDLGTAPSFWQFRELGVGWDGLLWEFWEEGISKVPNLLGWEGLLALPLSFRGSRAPSSLLTLELYGSRRQPRRQFVVKMTKFTLGTLKRERGESYFLVSKSH